MSEAEMRKEENLEHEVLDRLKNLEPMDFDYNAVDASYVDAILKARNIILDLYQKEKEKNKKAIEYINENCSINNCDFMDDGVGNLFKDILELLEERN